MRKSGTRRTTIGAVNRTDFPNNNNQIKEGKPVAGGPKASGITGNNRWLQLSRLKSANLGFNTSGRFAQTIAMTDRYILSGSTYAGGAMMPTILYNYKNGEYHRIDTKPGFPATGSYVVDTNPYSMNNQYAAMGLQAVNASRGNAAIYNISSQSWTDLSTTAGQPITALAGGSLFGCSTASSDDNLVIGAFGVNAFRGNAYIYNYNTGAWTDLSTTAGQPITALADTSRFGYSVDIRGDIVIIGAYNTAAGRGNAYTYNISTGVWTDLSTTANQPITSLAASSQFGYYVFSNSTHAFIMGFNLNGNKGGCYMYNLSTGEWADLTGTIGQPFTGSNGKIFQGSANDEYAAFTQGNFAQDTFLFDIKKTSWLGSMTVLSKRLQGPYPTSVGNFLGYGVCDSNINSSWLAMGFPYGYNNNGDIVLFDTSSLIPTNTKLAIISTTGAGTYTIPSDFYSLISVSAIGGGGDGATAGGGGGAFATSTTVANLTAGGTVYYNVGSSGGDTWFNAVANSAPTVATNGVLAKAGANAVTTTSGTGGASASCIGTTVFSGGNGGGTVYSGGGGAAGAAGTGKNGGNGSATTSAGGGGGGGNNGSAGGSSGASAGGNGGNGPVFGSGAGATATVVATAGKISASAGGGGGFSPNTAGANGSIGAIWTLLGSGGGGGGGYTAQGGNGGLYGGGGGGGSPAGTGAQGVIVLLYNSK